MTKKFGKRKMSFQRFPKQYIVLVIFSLTNSLSPYNILIRIYHCTKKELTCLLFDWDKESCKQKESFPRFPIESQNKGQWIVSVIFNFTNTVNHYNILNTIYHCTKKQYKCSLFAVIILQYSSNILYGMCK